jgi:hypothetical protein
VSSLASTSVSAAEPTHPGWDWYDFVLTRARRFLRPLPGASFDADDFAHEFFGTVVIGRGMYRRLINAGAGASALLHAALHEFLIERLRWMRSDARLQAAVACSRCEVIEEAASHAADRQSAVSLVQEALRRTEDYCRANGLERHWEYFEERVLRPSIHLTNRPSVRRIAARDGDITATRISVMLQDVRRVFRRHLLESQGLKPGSPREASRMIGELVSMVS